MNIVNSAKKFGCYDVVPLNDKPTPRHLDYLDLLKISPDKKLKVDAVAEFQSRPLLYIVDGTKKRNADDKTVLKLQQLLANRGESAYLGFLSPGELNVYPVNLDRSVLKRGETRRIKKDAPEARQFFQSIVNGGFSLKGHPEASDYVFNTIRKLMTESSQRLIGKYGLNPLDVLSFLGRALFFRFLLDRKIIFQRELSSICPDANRSSDCFSNKKNCLATCRWLDDTFNGDLLPLSGSYHKVLKQADAQTDGELFRHLQAIIEGWEHIGQGNFQLQLQIDWRDLDFSHIPIGVLSQVYENFSREWDGQQATATSVYYTPKNIARYLVDDAFENIADKRSARILDPSCGAGIFLILAFRKLFAARWKSDKKRPNTKTIQSILYNQLCGFDVSESALRLTALSLYITAIELNDSPRPPKSLKFPKPLKDKVLFNHRRKNERDIKAFVLGSLRPDLSSDFTGQFDLVIGNPPWSRLRGDRATNRTHNAVFTELCKRAMRDRGLVDIAKDYNNPDNDPDLPFLWAAAQWAKPDAIIAMALPSRIFLKQTEPGVRAFNAILHGITITGILNGSNLSDTEVWPGMNQPFMLFFARNSVPAQNHCFHFVTPHFEQHLNEEGRVRIDYQSAQPVAIQQILECSWFLKTIAMGTTLDLEVVNKLDKLNYSTVNSYWDEKGLYSGLGYNRSPGLPQKTADFMHGLPDFTPPAKKCFHVNTEKLSKFVSTEAHMPRSPELYKPPMLIIPQSPGESKDYPKSWVIHSPVVFRQSYYGFSAYGLDSPNPLISLLHLITHSRLYAYHVLMTSSRMGAERRTFLKDNIANFPFPNIEKLSEQQLKLAEDLSIQLETSKKKPWEKINNFIFNLYAMDKYDRQVIEDTLNVSAPFKKSRSRANAVPSRDERDTFYSELRQLLAPSFEVTGEAVTIKETNNSEPESHCPWKFFFVSTKPPAQKIIRDSDKLISQVIKEANKSGCSRAIIHGKDYLVIGVLGQYRYWTLSRARLCALDIVRSHLDAFPIKRS
ncbi:MAG: N-6 DNA methylase [Deltaproteobacteria bacterium]|nr:N-6 DNA methylase [Deltaproteobacteria bacterium]